MNCKQNYLQIYGRISVLGCDCLSKGREVVGVVLTHHLLLHSHPLYNIADNFAQLLIIYDLIFNQGDIDCQND